MIALSCDKCKNRAIWWAIIPFKRQHRADSRSFIIQFASAHPILFQFCEVNCCLSKLYRDRSNAIILYHGFQFIHSFISAYQQWVSPCYDSRWHKCQYWVPSSWEFPYLSDLIHWLEKYCPSHYWGWSYSNPVCIMGHWGYAPYHASHHW